MKQIVVNRSSVKRVVTLSWYVVTPSCSFVFIRSGHNTYGKPRLRYGADTTTLRWWYDQSRLHQDAIKNVFLYPVTLFGRRNVQLTSCSAKFEKEDIYAGLYFTLFLKC